MNGLLHSGARLVVGRVALSGLRMGAALIVARLAGGSNSAPMRCC
ncbi:hypothetical protein [Sphingomonas sp. VDB2]